MSQTSRDAEFICDHQAYNMENCMPRRTGQIFPCSPTLGDTDTSHCLAYSWLLLFQYLCLVALRHINYGVDMTALSYSAPTICVLNAYIQVEKPSGGEEREKVLRKLEGRQMVRAFEGVN